MLKGTIENRQKYSSSMWIWTMLLLVCCLSCKKRAEKEDQVKIEERHLNALEDSAYVVEVTAADYAFGMPTEVPSGWVTFRMKNMGQETHNGIIYKYSDTLTYQDLGKIVGDALREKQMTNPEHPFSSQIEAPMGGPAILSPGLTGQTTVLLEPGVYALTCWMVAEDGEYHAMKGMTRPFVVTEENSGAKKPKATVDVTLEDLAIHIEDSIEAGENVFNVKFETMENVHLARLGEGQDLEELKEWMNKAQNPSPFIFLGGAEQAPVGMTHTFKANLEPGRYALVTYGRAVLGMAEEFEISEAGAAAPRINKPLGPAVTVKITPDGTELSSELQTGRTAIKLSANENKQGYYVMSRLKDGRTVEELMSFWEDAYVHRKVEPSVENIPFNYVWDGPIGAEEEVELNLEIEDATYVLTGPMPPQDQIVEQWKGDEMFHTFAVKENP